jgi:hypothetical protein
MDRHRSRKELRAKSTQDERHVELLLRHISVQTSDNPVLGYEVFHLAPNGLQRYIKSSWYCYCRHSCSEANIM